MVGAPADVITLIRGVIKLYLPEELKGAFRNGYHLVQIEREVAAAARANEFLPARLAAKNTGSELDPPPLPTILAIGANPQDFHCYFLWFFDTGEILADPENLRSSDNAPYFNRLPIAEITLAPTLAGLLKVGRFGVHADGRGFQHITQGARIPIPYALPDGKQQIFFHV